MGTVLYLLVFAGLFMLMMRFGCGAHVMGHNQHSGHKDDADVKAPAPNRVNRRTEEHTHG